MTTKLRRRFFHIPKGLAYTIENSYVGLAAAYALGFRWIDIDLQRTKDGVLVAAHWGLIRRDKFELPVWFVKKYGKNPRVSQVMWTDLSKLRTPVISYRGRRFRNQYRTAEQIMTRAARGKFKMGIEFEAKGDHDFTYKTTWASLEESRKRAGLPASKVNIKTLTNLPGWDKRLKAAHTHFDTILLTGHQKPVPVIPRSYEAFITYIRGPWRRGPAGS